MATVAATPRFTTITLATASAGPFEVGFRIFSDADLRLFVDDVLTEDFTVSALFDKGYSDGATFSLLAPADAGTVLRIESILPAARGDDYLPSDPGLTRKMNEELGRNWSVLGDIRRDLDRAPKIPPSFEGLADPALPLPIPGHVLVANALGSGWQNGPTEDEISAAAEYAARAEAAMHILETFTIRSFGQIAADGRTGTYALLGAPVDVTAVEVFYDGVRQVPFVDYLVLPGPVIQPVGFFPDAPVIISYSYNRPVDDQTTGTAPRTYPTRADFIVDIPVLAGLTNGAIVHAGGVGYIRDNTAVLPSLAVIPDALGWRPLGNLVTPQHFGGLTGAAVTAAWTYYQAVMGTGVAQPAAATGGMLMHFPGGLYNSGGGEVVLTTAGYGQTITGDGKTTRLNNIRFVVADSACVIRDLEIEGLAKAADGITFTPRGTNIRHGTISDVRIRDARGGIRTIGDANVGWVRLFRVKAEDCVKGMWFDRVIGISLTDCQVDGADEEGIAVYRGGEFRVIGTRVRNTGDVGLIFNGKERPQVVVENYLLGSSFSGCNSNPAKKLSFPILSAADNGSGGTRLTLDVSGGRHHFSTGLIKIPVEGTTSYNGSHVLNAVTDTTVDIAVAYVSSQTGTIRDYGYDVKLLGDGAIRYGQVNDIYIADCNINNLLMKDCVSVRVEGGRQKQRFFLDGGVYGLSRIVNARGRLNSTLDDDTDEGVTSGSWTPVPITGQNYGFVEDIAVFGSFWNDFRGLVRRVPDTGVALVGNMPTYKGEFGVDEVNGITLKGVSVLLLNAGFLPRSFALRSDFIAALASLSAVPSGTVVMAEGLSYVRDASASMIADAPGWAPFGKRITPQHFGGLTGAALVAAWGYYSTVMATTAGNQHANVAGLEFYCPAGRYNDGGSAIVLTTTGTGQVIRGDGESTRLMRVTIRLRDARPTVEHLSLEGVDKLADGILVDPHTGLSQRYGHVSNLRIRECLNGIHLTGDNAWIKFDNIDCERNVKGRYIEDTKGVTLSSCNFQHNDTYGSHLVGGGEVRSVACEFGGNGLEGELVEYVGTSLVECYWDHCSFSNNYTGASGAGVSSRQTFAIASAADNGAGGTTLTIGPHSLTEGMQGIAVLGTTSYGAATEVFNVTNTTVDIAVPYVSSQTGTLRRPEWDFRVKGNPGAIQTVNDLLLTGCNINFLSLKDCYNVTTSDCRLKEQIWLDGGAHRYNRIGPIRGRQIDSYKDIRVSGQNYGFSELVPASPAAAGWTAPAGMALRAPDPTVALVGNFPTLGYAAATENGVELVRVSILTGPVLQSSSVDATAGKLWVGTANGVFGIGTTAGPTTITDLAAAPPASGKYRYTASVSNFTVPGAVATGGGTIDYECYNNANGFLTLKRVSNGDVWGRPYASSAWGTWEPIFVAPLTSIAAAPAFVGQRARVSNVNYEAIGTASAADWRYVSGYLTSIAAAPPAVGALALSGGALYIAKGTSGPGDWVAI